MSNKNLDSDSDDFVEASEIFADAGDQNLEHGLFTAKKVLDLFLNNEYQSAEKLSQESSNIYISFSYASIKSIESLASFQTNDFNSAVASLKLTNNLCNSFRNSEIKAKKIKSDYSDFDIHVELCHAESMLQLALIKIAKDEKLLTLMKSGIKIRECYKTYEWCWNYLQSQPQTKRDYKLKEFECGVYFGFGLFNLMISSVSEKILKVLQFVGFKGDRDLGLKLLRKGAAMTDNLRSVLCSLTLLCYYFYITPILDIDTIETLMEGNLLLKIWFEKYPESAFFLFYAGRASLIEYNLNQAKSYFDKSINVQTEWKNFHDICYWELMWCHAIEQDWWLALKYSEKLLISSNWSQVIYRYLKSVFIYQFIEENRGTDDEQIIAVISRYHSHMETCLADIPNFKQTIAGKSIPVEKFLIKKSKTYEQTRRMILPGIEMMYVWNIFKLVDKSSKHYAKLINICRKTRDRIPSSNDSKLLREIGFSYFLEGCIFLHAGKDLKNSQKIFDHIIRKYSSTFDSESYVLPYTYFELANVHYLSGNIDKCRELIYQVQSMKKFNLQNRLLLKMESLIDKCNNYVQLNEEGIAKLRLPSND